MNGRLPAFSCRRLWPAAVLAAAMAFGDAAQAQVSGLEVAVYRTLRGAGATHVDGVVEFEPRIVRGGEDCAYSMNIVVRDSSDTRIYEDGWTAVLGCEDEQDRAAEAGRVVVETFQFAVAPGRYRVQVSVEPAGQSDAARSASVEFVSLAESTLVSDLILGRDVGFIDTTSATSQWTVSKGGIGIAADPFVVAKHEDSSLAYYLEIYRGPEADWEGELVGVISRRHGAEVTRTTLATLGKDAVSRPVAGKMSLAGLPPGEYALDVRLELSDTVVTCSRGFAVAAVMAGSVERSPEGQRLFDYFSSLSDEELTALFDPVEIWIGQEALRRTYRSLTPDGKRNFLTSFFEHVAPTVIVVVPGETALDVYLERARFVRDNYGGRGIEERAGWVTDRGRIYIKRGRPNRKFQRAYPEGNSPPYEIWVYEVEQGFVYLFVDETRFGYYRLYYSTDPLEPDMPDWAQRVGRSTLQNLERMTGIRVLLPS